MAIVNTTIGATDTTILTVPAGKKFAVTTILVCNTSTNDGSGIGDTSFDMHVVVNGDAKGSDNQVLNDLDVPSADTFTFNVERLVLEEGDRIIMVGAPPTNLSVTLSYLEV